LTWHGNIHYAKKKRVRLKKIEEEALINYHSV
jgi:hypothetical protein